MTAMEGPDIDLEEALSIAIEAACLAGSIMWTSVLERRAGVAASAAPTQLPQAAWAKDGDEDREGTASAGATAAKSVLLPPLESLPMKRHSEPQSSPLPPPIAVDSSLQVECKDSPNDLVTAYDKRCEAAIVEVLQTYCDYVEREKGTTGLFTFITEEMNPLVPLGDGLTWVVDPIDGTMSFVHGLPDCCVSIGLVWRGATVLAVTFCPFLVTGGVTVDQAMRPWQQFYQQHANGAAGAGAPTGTTTPSAKAGGGSSSAVPQQRPVVSSQQRLIPQPPAAVAGLAAGRRGNTNASHPSPTSPLAWGGNSVGDCMGELFTAIRGRGCYLNGTRVHVNAEATPATAMAVFNFPSNVKLTPAEQEQAAQNPSSAAAREAIRKVKLDKAVDVAATIRSQLCADMVPGVRAYGSSVTTLSQLAAGRIDLYAEPTGKIWDVCAGTLLVTEAGGVVRNLHGKPFDMRRDTTVVAAANPDLATYATGMCAAARYGEFCGVCT